MFRSQSKTHMLLLREATYPHYRYKDSDIFIVDSKSTHQVAC